MNKTHNMIAKFSFALLLTQAVAFGQIPKGIGQAHMPSELIRQDVRIDQMRVGESVKAFSNAVIVDKNGKVWLKPNYIGFSINDQSLSKISDLEIRKTRSGYMVDVQFKYKKINGYSVPYHPHWDQSSKVYNSRLYGYLPVSGVRVLRPAYQTRARAMDYQEPPPRIMVPPNPYK